MAYLELSHIFHEVIAQNPLEIKQENNFLQKFFRELTIKDVLTIFIIHHTKMVNWGQNEWLGSSLWRFYAIKCLQNHNTNDDVNSPWSLIPQNFVQLVINWRWWSQLSKRRFSREQTWSFQNPFSRVLPFYYSWPSKAVKRLQTLGLQNFSKIDWPWETSFMLVKSRLKCLIFF